MPSAAMAWFEADRNAPRPESSSTTTPATSTVGFLVSRPGTRTTKLLGLTPPIIRDQQCSIILHERLLQLVLGVFIHVFLVVGDNALGDRLTDGIDLRRVTAAGDPDPDIDLGELVKPDDQEWLVDLCFCERGSVSTRWSIRP